MVSGGFGSAGQALIVSAASNSAGGVSRTEVTSDGPCGTLVLSSSAYEALAVIHRQGKDRPGEDRHPGTLLLPSRTPMVTRQGCLRAGPPEDDLALGSEAHCVWGPPSLQPGPILIAKDDMRM